MFDPTRLFRAYARWLALRDRLSTAPERQRALLRQLITRARHTRFGRG